MTPAPPPTPRRPPARTLPPPNTHAPQSAAVVRAQAGALRAEALRERARRMRRVLPDATPTISLLLGLSPEEVSQRILASVNVFRCGASQRSSLRF